MTVDPADDDPIFIAAVSLCAEIEGLCSCEATRPLLAYVGLTRCALTDFGARLPARIDHVDLASAEEGVERLDALLTALLDRSQNLYQSLRAHEARVVLREGITFTRHNDQDARA